MTGNHFRYEQPRDTAFLDALRVVGHSIRRFSLTNLHLQASALSDYCIPARNLAVIMSPLVWVLLCSCTAWAEVFRWHPPSALDGIRKRQDGYSPDYNSCGTGHDCSSCGDSFEQCPAATSLALFCYDPTAGQKCCPNGQGKACDRGYYCAMDDMHQTWCCPDVRVSKLKHLPR